jgi:hypothetical protein
MQLVANQQLAADLSVATDRISMENRTICRAKGQSTADFRQAGNQFLQLVLSQFARGDWQLASPKPGHRPLHRSQHLGTNHA